MKSVFGNQWHESKGLQLKNKQDITKPKDKWRVGRELKKL